MQKLTTILTISALMLAASCNKAEAPVQEEAMTFSVSIPATKAVDADGSAINKVWFGLYKTDGTLVKNFGAVDFENGSAECPVTMVRDQSYKVVFVAYKENSYGINPANATVSFSENPYANSDDFDLFYQLLEVNKYDGAKTESVVLNRAVALVNFRSSDSDWTNASALLGAVPTYSSITLKGIPTTLNLLTGETSATEDVDFARRTIPDDKYLAAAYCFPGDNITTTINLYTADNDNAIVSTLTVGNVPIAANKQTNITGSIMTDTVDFDITISTGTPGTNDNVNIQ